MYGRISGNPSDEMRNEQGAVLPSLDACRSCLYLKQERIGNERSCKYSRKVADQRNITL